MADTVSDAGIDITENGDGGVLKRVIKEGEGTETPKVGYEVSVHYTGTLLDGTKFDSSKDRNEPFQFDLGKRSVIKAWDIGVATMKKGEVCVLTCAPEYAYGIAGSPPKIPPKATLKFEIEMLDWKEEDLSPNKNMGILRHVIEPGVGGNHPSNDAEVTVELEGKLQADGKLFDKRTVTFTLGEGCEIDVCEGVERALESFTKGEKSRLTIQPKYAFKSKGNENLGVPSNAVVVYTVTLTDFVKGKQIWTMSDEELIEEAILYKAKGTESFKSGKFLLAIKQYKKVLNYLKDISERKNAKESIVFNQVNDVLLSTHLNLALVYLKVCHYSKAVEHADKALRLEPRNVKALFRGGQALLCLGEAETARDYFRKVLEVEPDNKAAANQLKLCSVAIQKQKQKDRQLYVNMFDKFAKHDNEVEKQRARSEADAMGSGVGEWGAAEGEWTEKQRDRKPTHFEQENPNILMLDKDGRFQNM